MYQTKSPESIPLLIDDPKTFELLDKYDVLCRNIVHNYAPFKCLDKDPNDDALLEELENEYYPFRHRHINEYLSTEENKGKRLYLLILETIKNSEENPIPQDLSFGRFNDQHFSYITEEIQSVVSYSLLQKSIKDNEKRNFQSERLISHLKICDPNEAWSHILEYGRNKANADQKLYRLAKEAITKIVVNYEMQLSYVNSYLKKISKKDVGNVQENISIAEEIEKCGKAIAALNECPYDVINVNMILPILRLQQAKLYFENRQYALALESCMCPVLNKYASKKQYTELTNFKLDIVHNLLNQDAYSIPKTSSKPAFFGKTILKGIEKGILPAKSIVSAGDACECVVTPLLLLGIPIGAIGIAFGLVVGLLQGIAQAATRKIITTDQQNQLVKNLKTCIASSENEKKNIIGTIVQQYTEKMSVFAQSDSSYDLLEKLSAKKVSTEEKWKAIEYFMLEQEGDLLKNNGKRLFCIINNEVECYVNNQHIESPAYKM